MRTKSVALYYKLTQTEVVPPAQKDLERKELWIKELQKTVEAEYKALTIKVEYTMYDPEIQKLSRFFNGTIVKYYAIQNSDMFSGEPDNETLKQYREEILDEVLGYDYQTVHKVIRRRKSTADYKTVQAYNNFVKLVEETVFDSAGYEFPNSEEFWALAKEHGYDKAERISIERLQRNMSGRVKNPK